MLDRRRRRRLRHVGEGIFDRGNLPAGWIFEASRSGPELDLIGSPTAAPITPFKSRSPASAFFPAADY